MDLEQIMQMNTFAVVGDTLNPEKYAYKIKEGLLEQGYTVHSVGKELQSLNEIPGDLDIIDLCINPAKGIQGVPQTLPVHRDPARRRKPGDPQLSPGAEPALYRGLSAGGHAALSPEKAINPGSDPAPEIP